MCRVVLEKSEINNRFLIMNTILAKTSDFSIEEISSDFNSEIVSNCLRDLIDNGLVYEVGNKYMVRDRQKRWSKM